MRQNRLKIDIWLVVVLIFFTIFAWANWGKIGNPIIDFGREIEIPARILDGQIVYRDAVTYYGPLAYYVNALALLIFGHHLEVFYVVSLVLVFLVTLLFYNLAKQLMNALWAALCTISMLLSCAIGPGIFNFVVPYSYGAVYATLFCLLALTFFDYYVCKGQIRWLIAAAIACGLAGLAKQEYGVAVLGGVLIGTNLYCPQSLWDRVRRSLLVLFIAGICTFFPLYLLAQQISWEKLYLSLFPLPKVSFLKQSTLFQVSPFKTLRFWLATFRRFFVASVAIWISIFIAHQLAKLKTFRFRWLKFLSEILLATTFTWVSLSFLQWLFQFIPSFAFLHSIPNIIFQPLGDLSWCLPVIAVWFALTKPQVPQYKHAPLLWALFIFALLLNARWLFYINFYGLYATPVVLLFFIFMYYLNQKFTQRFNKIVLNYFLICILIASTIKMNELAQYNYAVHSSHGSFYTWDAKLAQAFNQTINAIQTSGASSVLVLPESSILTFMTATHSPSRIITFQPLALPDTNAEHEFLASMKQNPPELIVYVDMLFQEWGYQNYAEFNPSVHNWITQQHQLIHVFPKSDGVIRIYSQK